jgi:hypothetical protein
MAENKASAARCNAKRSARMSRLSIPRKNQPPTKSYRRDVGAPQKEWPSFVKASPNPHLLTIVALCLIVLLVALNLIFLFPDFGAVVEQYNQF